jgi:hypothetical protein
MSMSLDAVPQTLDALDAWLWKHLDQVFWAGDCGECVLAQYFSDQVGREIGVSVQDAYFIEPHIKTPGIMLSADFLLVRVLFDKRWQGGGHATGHEVTNRIMVDARLIREAFYLEMAEAVQKGTVE